MRRWLFSVRVIVFKGVEDLDSTAVVRMEASMQSAWSVSGSCDDYFVIFNVFKAWGRHKAGGQTRGSALVLATYPGPSTLWALR